MTGLAPAFVPGLDTDPLIISPGSPRPQAPTEVFAVGLRPSQIPVSPVADAVPVLQRSRTDRAAGSPYEDAREEFRSGRRPSAVAVSEAAVSEVLAVVGGGGQPLDERTRAEMQARLGGDFSSVRVHIGDAAAKSAAAVHARAYTLGDAVVFGADAYAPGSLEGQRVLAHELVHVQQQRRGFAVGPGIGLAVSDPGDLFEREAESVADQALQVPSVARPVAGEPRAATGPGHIGRQVSQVVTEGSRTRDLADGRAFAEAPDESARRAALEAAHESPAVEPHSGGTASEALTLLSTAASNPALRSADATAGGAADGGAGIESISGPGSASGGYGDRDRVPGGPGQAPSPEPEPPAEDPAVAAVRAWMAEQPTTNAAYAQFVLDADAEGFVHWTAAASKGQVESLAKGEQVAQADPLQKKILGGLKIIHDLIAQKVGKWIGNPAKPKETVAIGSFLRTTDPHGTGRMIDINEFDWTGKDGPDQVAEALAALTPGNYGIGLPFQGEFFPHDEWFETSATKAGAAAKGGDPAPITAPSLVKWTTYLYTATWNPRKKEGTKDRPGWDMAKASGRAVDHLKSDSLKRKIANLNKAGYTIYVFPDNNNHIHIQTK